MNSIDALFTKPVCDAAFSLRNASVKQYNHCLFTLDDEQLVVQGNTLWRSTKEKAMDAESGLEYEEILRIIKDPEEYERTFSEAYSFTRIRTYSGNC